MFTRQSPLALLFVAAALAGCGDHEEHGVDAEICEHLKEGPAKAVVAAATSSAAPSATFEHTRVDLTLVDVAGQKGGFVRYEADAANDFVIALSKNVALRVTGPEGAAVAIEKTETTGAACPEVAVRHTVPMTVGAHVLSFGPTTETSLGMVVEANTSDGHEHH